MKKSEAIELLGGSLSAAADVLGVTVSAVSQWPDELPDRIAQRVVGAAYMAHKLPIGTDGSNSVEDRAAA